MTVPTWQRIVASASAALLESVGGPKIGGGLTIGTFVAPSLVPTPSGTRNNSQDTFIEFWSSQCSPCVEMIPKMKRFYKQYNNSVNFQTIHVNLHCASREEIKQFIVENKIDYPVDTLITEDYEHHHDIWETFQFSHLPHGLLLNSQGMVLWSGSLFTHDLDGVFQQFYGKQRATNNDNDEVEATPPPTAVLHVAQQECSGGVCQRPLTVNKKSTPPPARTKCTGVVCQRPLTVKR